MLSGQWWGGGSGKSDFEYEDSSWIAAAIQSWSSTGIEPS